MVIPQWQCPFLKGTSPNFTLNTSYSLLSIPRKQSLVLSSVSFLSKRFIFSGQSLGKVLYSFGKSYMNQYGFVWSGIISYRDELFGPQESSKVLYSLKWYCMVMGSLIWSFMACMILYGLVWFSIVYATIFPYKVSNGLLRSCMALRSYVQFLCLF